MHAPSGSRGDERERSPKGKSTLAEALAAAAAEAEAAISTDAYMPDAAPDDDAGACDAAAAGSVPGAADIAEEAAIAAAAAEAILRCVVDAWGPAAAVEAAAADAAAAQAAAEAEAAAAAAAAAAAPAPAAAEAEPSAAPLRLGARVLLPPGGLPRAARTARAASRPLAGPSLSPRSPLPTRGPPSTGVVLPPLAAPTTTLAARTSEGRPRRALLLPPRGPPWSPEWWQPQEMRLPPPACMGLAGLATPAAPSSTASPWLRLQRAGRGMGLCTELGEVSEFHAAARYALASCPPNAPAGLSELFIFTDDSAAPPACPDVSARLGWSAVYVGRCRTGYHFLGALFHGVASPGDVVQRDPVGDSNTMELAAVLWALVWVVIS